jgi:hypothetical protein
MVLVPSHFYGWNKNKTITQLTGLGNQSIHRCRGKIPLHYCHAYQQLHVRSELAKVARSKTKEMLNIQITDQQEDAINSQ